MEGTSDSIMKNGMAKKSNCKSITWANWIKKRLTGKVNFINHNSTIQQTFNNYFGFCLIGSEIDGKLQSGERQEVPVRKIEGLSLPYLLVTMDTGTMCDLSGKPRLARVFYVCYPAGKHEIFSLEEASTCEYEIVVLTPYICQHPDYRFDFITKE